jgi:hypothetical protein
MIMSSEEERFWKMKGISPNYMVKDKFEGEVTIEEEGEEYF